MERYDLVIVGAGPAGLTAAIYARRAGLKTLVLDKNVAGGLVNDSPLIENYPGFARGPGAELVSRMKAHAQEYAEIRELEEVRRIEWQAAEFRISTSQGEYSASSVLLCTGTAHKKLGVEGEDRLQGKGVSYCSTCDGFFFRGKRVAVIGGGNSGAIAAIYLSEICEKVTVLEYMPRWMCEDFYRRRIEELKIAYLMNVETLEILGEDRVKGVRFRDRETGEEKKLAVDGVFIYVGLLPQNQLARDLGVTLSDKGYVVTDRKMRTNVKRVYAAGDLTGEPFQVVVACAEGATAALSAYEDVRLA